MPLKYKKGDKLINKFNRSWRLTIIDVDFKYFVRSENNHNWCADDEWLDSEGYELDNSTGGIK